MCVGQAGVRVHGDLDRTGLTVTNKPVTLTARYNNKPYLIGHCLAGQDTLRSQDKLVTQSTSGRSFHLGQLPPCCPSVRLSVGRLEAGH